MCIFLANAIKDNFNCSSNVRNIWWNISPSKSVIQTVIALKWDTQRREKDTFKTRWFSFCAASNSISRVRKPYYLPRLFFNHYRFPKRNIHFPHNPIEGADYSWTLLWRLNFFHLRKHYEHLPRMFVATTDEISDRTVKLVSKLSCNARNFLYWSSANWHWYIFFLG